MTQFPYLLGRQAAVHPVGYAMVDEVVDANSIADAPATFDHLGDFDGFEMLGNGPDSSLTVNGGRPVGDCGFVGTVNLGVTDAVCCMEHYDIPASDTVVTSYLAFDHGVDQGVNLSALLAYWTQFGLPWAKPPKGYAGLNFRDVDAVWAYLAAFDSLYTGIVVTSAMQEQTQRGEPWDITGTDADFDVQGGHCVVMLPVRTSDGGEFATWGMRQPFTERWLRRYVEECHVVLTEQLVARNGNGFGLDEEKLAAYMARLSQQAAA